MIPAATDDRPGPIVIGAVGGSGTRVVADILMRAGCFMGGELNASSDALAFVGLYDRWAAKALHHWLRDDGPPPSAMGDDLARALQRHVAGITPAHQAWGWKNPRSMLLLPWLAELLPGLRFIHVVRDGRDMALSANQNQPALYAPILGLEAPDDGTPALAAMRYWNRVNLMVAGYGQARLTRRYLRVRFEDLCMDSAPTVDSVLRFAQLPQSLCPACMQLVSAPASIGRWHGVEPSILRQLEMAGTEALCAFGYIAG